MDDHPGCECEADGRLREDEEENVSFWKRGGEGESGGRWVFVSIFFVVFFFFWVV